MVGAKIRLAMTETHEDTGLRGKLAGAPGKGSWQSVVSV